MQSFQLKDLLQAVGPTASLIFAAWIFLNFLQSRYTAAYDRYRALIAEYRVHREQDRRRQSLRDQILEYKRRCEQMRKATHLGVLAAIVLISALIFAALDTIYDQLSLLKYLSATCAVGGLLLVIWAATYVIVENSRLQLIIDSDLSDVPDLQEGAIDPRRVGAQSNIGAQSKAGRTD
ncbi:MAG: conserved rane protein of unknown function [Gammaproteobacteria bacterium]|nr:conserved rane protein of unknown function [Gammaproteobacteria bacterium]